MRDPLSILSSGGILTAEDAASPSVKSEPLDGVVTRTWGHPALGERVIVRLVPEGLVPGADAEMSALGFAAPTPGKLVGQQRRRAPGFPGWALLNDPRNAKYALEVVQDLKKAARLAQSKPGHARDALIAIGTKLARTTPHFLPSYWEEAGRVFLGVGNHAYAAQSFEKAREAERQFALPVDERTRADAFVEFALSGALAAKSLVAYARTLAESKDKALSYGLFRDLCARRTLGGAPPFSGMGKELRALAKAAGLDATAEERSFLRDVLPAPSMVKAPAEAWKIWNTALEGLAREDAAIATRLTDLFPEPSSGGEEAFQTSWLAFLEKSGCITKLLDAKSSDSGRAAAWYRKLLGWLDGNAEQATKLMQRLAPRFLADGVSLDLVPPDTWRSEIDPNLLELALSLKLPLVTPSEDVTLDFDVWEKAGAEAPDLALIAADERYSALIARSIGGSVGDEDFETAARGKPSLMPARRAWLVEHVGKLSMTGMPAFEDALETLESKTGPALYAEFPEGLVGLKAIDASPMLAHTLRAGVFDELGWPALEATHKALEGNGPKKASVELGGTYPWLVLSNERKAVVLGPDGPVFTHDLVLPKGADVTGFRYSGGQLLVIYRDDSYQGKGYWSAHPNETFDVENHYRFGWRSQPAALITEGPKAGVIVEGRRAMNPGDTKFAESERIYSDGKSFWYEDDDAKVEPAERPVLRRFDPLTGQAGAVERPAFFESFVAGRTDRRVGPVGALQLLPATPGVTASPLGVSDGLVGLRARIEPPKPKVEKPTGRPEGDPDADADEEEDESDGDVMELEGIDGRLWHNWADGSVPDALLLLPGLKGPLAVVNSGYRGDHTLWEAAGAEDDCFSVCELDSSDLQPAGTPVMPRVEFWHCFSPRDLAGSAVLRGVSDDLAHTMLTEAVAALAKAEADEAEAETSRKARRGSTKDEEAPDPTLAIVRKHLPGIGHDGLVAGVAQQVKFAAELTRRVEKLHTAAAEAPEEETAPSDGFDDSDIVAILGRQLTGVWYGYNDLSKQLAAVAGHLKRAAEGTGKPGQQVLPSSDLKWTEWLGRERGLAYLALSPLATFHEDAGQKVAFQRMLRRLADFPWAAAPAEWQVRELTFENEKSPFVMLDPDLDPDDYEEGDPLPVAEYWAAVEADAAQFVFRLDDDTDRPIRLRVISKAVPADAPLPTGATLVSSRAPSETPSDALLRTAAELLGAATPTELPPGVGALIAAETGLSPGEATLLFAGNPSPNGRAADFLGKALREALGMKVADAKAAKDGVDSLESGKFLELFAAALPDDLASLRTPLEPAADGKSAAQHFAAAFLSVFGPRVPLPEELLQAVDKLSSLEMDSRAFLTALARPDLPSVFQRDGAYHLDAWGDVEAVPDPVNKTKEAYFEAEAAVSLVTFLCYAHAELPPGDPFRLALAAVVEQARARLENPKLLFGLGTWYGGDKKDKKRQKAYFDSLGGEHWAPVQSNKEDPPHPTERGRDTGLLQVWADEDGDLSAAWRPARLNDVSDWEALAQTLAMFNDDDSTRVAHAVRFLKAEKDGARTLAAAAARSPDGATRPGATESDPRVSAPETVAAAAAALNLSADAAALYLQLLALPRPTQKAVTDWNGWKPAAFKAASAALDAAGLVVTGKRPRAGREQFLPGGWEELSAPDLPIETWKVALYDLQRDEDGDLKLPFGQILLAKPVGDLFRAAWARIAAGDKPALEQIKTGRAAKAERAGAGVGKGSKA